MPEDRRLVAIMFTDIVGYTTMMGESEVKAFEIINSNRDLHQRLIKKHGGKIVKELGDGLLSIFENGTAAVLCSIEIQQEALIKSIPLRIGIHEGEVVFEKNDVFGDGINIASRIQQEAATGGVCISDTVYRIIRNKENIKTQSFGKKSLKNVKEPILLYQLKSNGLQTRSMNDFRKQNWLLIALIGIIFFFLGYIIDHFIIQHDPEIKVQRFTITLPEKYPVSPIGGAHFNVGQKAIAISPDGQTLVYVTDSGKSTMLMKRELSSYEVFPMDGTDGAYYPFFSPDGQWVAYFTSSHLKKVNIDGGQPLILCDVTHPYGGTWGTNDEIYFSNLEGRSLYSITSSDGSSKEVEILSRSRVFWPSFLPDDHVMYSGNIAYILNVDSGELKQIPLGTNFHYTSTNHLIYALRGRLMAIPFNYGNLSANGNPFPIVDNVRTESLRNSAQYDISENGTLVYLPGLSVDVGELVYVDKKGSIVDKIDIPPDYYGEFFISPDNQKIVLNLSENLFGEYQIKIYDKPKRMLVDLVDNLSIRTPIWDSEDILYFISNVDNQMYWKEYEKTGINLVNGIDSLISFQLFDISNDSEFMIISNGDLWSLDLTKSEHFKTLLNLSKSVESFATISPDNNYISYTSPESGQYEVYVIPYPFTGQKWQISKNGGMESKWSPDKKEIYYRSLDMKKMMVVPVKFEPQFEYGQSTVLWEGDSFLDIPRYSYDITPDGKYFLMKKGIVEKHATTQINVITNFFEVLKQTNTQ